MLRSYSGVDKGHYEGMMDIDIIRKGVELIAANLTKRVNVEDKVSLLNYSLKSWTEERFMKIVNYTIENFDRFPTVRELKSLYYNQKETERGEIEGCADCNYSGFRKYLTWVPVYNFKEKQIAKAKMICIAACGCSLGRNRKIEDPELPWYNDIIKREGVESIDGDTNVMHGVIKDMERRHIEELPF